MNPSEENEAPSSPIATDLGIPPEAALAASSSRRSSDVESLVSEQIAENGATIFRFPSDEKPRKSDKLFVTFCAFGAMMSKAICLRMLGPTIIDLAELMGVRESQITQVFFARAFGYFMGAIAAGVLFRYLNRTLLIMTSLFLLAVTNIAVPTMPTYHFLFGVLLLQGVGLGIVDPGISTYILDTWGEKSAPYMQMVYLGYGVGSLLTPQLAKPFLSASAANVSAEIDARIRFEKDEDLINIRTRVTREALHRLRSSWLVIRPVVASSESLAVNYEKISLKDTDFLNENSIHGAYFIAAGISAFFGLMYMAFMAIRPHVRFRENVPLELKRTIIARQSTMPQTGIRKFSDRNQEEEPKRRFSSRFLSDQMADKELLKGLDVPKPAYNMKKVAFLSAAALVSFCISGLQDHVSIFLVTFVVKHPLLTVSKTVAADIDTYFWAIFTGARVLTVLTTAFVMSVASVLAFCCALLVPSSALLVAFPFLGLDPEHARMVFMVAIFLWGGAEAPVFPSYLLFLKRYIPISHVEAAVLFSATAWGDVAIFLWGGAEAPVFPSYLLFLKRYIPISHVEAAVLFSATAWGDVVPFFVGFLLDEDNLMIIMTVTVALTFITVALITFTYVWGRFVLGEDHEDEAPVTSVTRGSPPDVGGRHKTSSSRLRDSTVQT
ncbi:unnamed protein product [Notodromas monacha]|uniref:Uncharacterized protein n=1 Tax=Notodromas monacha TaxID=399045 RepID=A0A7R9GFX2_9CRUS|nr:unnamed protein product [Notodromas monacha]CAG0919778.1 unnamed protein product [Notodromas monacha]